MCKQHFWEVEGWKKILSRVLLVKSNIEYFPINMHAILARHRPQQTYTHCYQEPPLHLRVEGKVKPTL